VTGGSKNEKAHIEVRALVKRFAGRTVLDHVSLSIARGTVTAIAGPSGVGKSTLLRCMHGLETFDAGELRVGPIVVRAGAGAAEASARLAIPRVAGYVFQQYHLFAHLDALANVTLAPTHVRKMPRHEATARGRDLLATVGLAARQHAFPHELSGGEQQRVAIARALAMEPEALFLDEPTSALDPARVRELVALLGELAKKGTTIVLVTHEVGLVEQLADEVITLAPV
jgi:polar amino acid transport system ATP-binding protein